MLADAVAAEAYKFLRQRGLLFWGFCAVPLGVLLFNLALDSWLHLHLHMPLSLDPGRQVIHGLGLGGSSFFQIFFVAGAATLFGGEYRWETWRLLTPRNSRVNLLGAKFIVYAVAAGLSLAALGVAAGVQTLYAALLGGRLVWPGDGIAMAAAGVFTATWAELLVLGAVTAFVVVLTRNGTGALMAGICFSFAQSLAMALVHPWEAPLRWFAALPSMDAYLLRAWASGQEIAPGILADPAKVLPAAGLLLGWIVLVGAAAMVRFQRQDLPRE